MRYLVLVSYVVYNVAMHIQYKLASCIDKTFNLIQLAARYTKYTYIHTYTLASW